MVDKDIYEVGNLHDPAGFDLTFDTPTDAITHALYLAKNNYVDVGIWLNDRLEFIVVNESIFGRLIW